MGLRFALGAVNALLRLTTILGLICCAFSVMAQSQRQLDLSGFPTGINGDELLARIASYRAGLPANAKSSIEIPWAINDQLGTVSLIKLGVGYGATEEIFTFTLDRPATKSTLGAAKITSVTRVMRLGANDLSQREFAAQIEAKFGRDIERYGNRYWSAFYLLVDQNGKRRPVGTNRDKSGPGERVCKFQAPNLNWGWASAVDWSLEPISDCGISINCEAGHREPLSAAEAQRADANGFVSNYRCVIVNEFLIRDGLVQLFRPPASTPGKL
jgi:hypothetical protein